MRRAARGRHIPRERRVHEQLLIEAIAREENISVDEKDFDQRIADMAAQAKVPTAELRHAKRRRKGSLDMALESSSAVAGYLSDAIIQGQRPRSGNVERGLGVMGAGFLENECLEFHFVLHVTPSAQFSL